MLLGYRATMDRWRTTSPSTRHLLLPSDIPSLSSPPSLLTSSSLPSPPLLLLPSSSRKRSRSPSPSLPTAVPPPPEHIESIGDDKETLCASLAYAMQETMTLRARVRSLEQHDLVTRESLRIARGRITRSQLQAEYAEQEETMSTMTQGMSFAEIKQIVAQRVANVIETIDICKVKTRMARDLMNRVERKKYKVAENASNKRKWEGDHGGSSNQQQNKEHKVIRVHTVELGNKKGYTKNLPLCNKCKFHHTGSCAVKCGNCKWVGHQTRDCRTPVPRAMQRPSVAK
uniref:Reverse transcriptase domain-containing protein n=1 Tax=Tanacetum cinerariifolium TaxID=118510 RepID=A0A699HAF3_TANCI|nr:reverse transcriptase domain-containing protein [Tanacetum cinerariifolium]